MKFLYQTFLFLCFVVFPEVTPHLHLCCLVHQQPWEKQVEKMLLCLHPSPYGHLVGVQVRLVRKMSLQFLDCLIAVPEMILVFLPLNMYIVKTTEVNIYNNYKYWPYVNEYVNINLVFLCLVGSMVLTFCAMYPEFKRCIYKKEKEKWNWEIKILIEKGSDSFCINHKISSAIWNK